MFRTAAVMILTLLAASSLLAQPQTKQLSSMDYTSYLPQQLIDLEARLATGHSTIDRLEKRVTSLQADNLALSEKVRFAERRADVLLAMVNALALRASNELPPGERALFVQQIVKGLQLPAPNVKVINDIAVTITPEMRAGIAKQVNDELEKGIGEWHTVLFSEPFYSPRTVHLYRSHTIKLRIVKGKLPAIPADLAGTYHSWLHVRLHGPVDPEIRQDASISVGQQSVPAYSGGKGTENEWSAQIKPTSAEPGTISIYMHGADLPPLVYPIKVDDSPWPVTLLFMMWYWATRPAVIAAAAAVVAVVSNADKIVSGLSKMWKQLFPAVPEAAEEAEAH